jgi:uncharacterized protein
MDPLKRGAVGLALLVVGLCVGAAVAGAQPLPELSQPVTDLANVVEADDAAEMDRMIRALQQATGDVVVVVTAATYAPYGDIREYAVKLFENHGRGIGEKGKDNGLLVLLAVNDRRVWVEVGYGLEQWITDGFAGETSREYMIPAFRQNDYSGGLRAGVAHIIGRIAEGRGVQLEGVQPVAAPRPAPGLSRGTVAFFVIVLLLILMSRGGGGRSGRFGRRRGYWGATGWSGWNSGVGPFGGGGSGGFGGGFGGFGGGGFGGFGGGRSGGGGGGGGW